MKKLLASLWLLLLPQIMGAAVPPAAVPIHTETSPKPARPNQPVYFRITVAEVGSLLKPQEISIWVAGEALAVQFENRIAREGNLADYYYRATAHSEFDWRKVHVRLNGMDYPSGPDDPYMICDAPFRVKSAGAPLPISVAFHDADNDDVQLQFVEVFNDATGLLINSYPVWEWISSPYRSYLFDDLTAWNFNCAAGDTAWIKVVLHCDDHDWPWIPEEYTFTQHLKVRVGRDLPALPGWYYGDVHDHSQYTNNVYEYGGPLEMFAAAAEAVGLSFVSVSDHSSDFDAAGNLWQQMAANCAAYSTDAVHLIPAEEVCLDDNEINNLIDNRIHFLNHTGIFIRGPEAPLTGSMDTSDEFTRLSQALAQAEEVGGFAYAAHPFQAFDPFVALFGMAMMTWSDENYGIARASSAFSGLEVWNERNRYRKNVSYWYDLNPFPWEDNPNWGFENTWITDGVAQWDEFLSAGLTQNLVVPAILPQKLFFSAGSDCHGDFNYRTYNSDPIFFDVYATDNAFGCLRTAVFVPGYGPSEIPPPEELMTAYRLGHSIATDGPFVEIGLDADGDGDLDDPGDIRLGGDGVFYANQADMAQVILRWESSEDWGTVQSAAIYRGTASTGSNPELVWTLSPNNYWGEQLIPLTTLVSSPSGGWVYLRAETQGSPLPDDARRAFTNPIWLRIDETPTASVLLDAQSLPVIIPTSGGSFDYTVRVNNYQWAPVNCNVWFEAVLPNGQTYPLMNVPLTLPANYTTSRLRTQAVPATAPTGDYAYRAHIGLYPTAWSSDGFMFSKIGASDLELGSEGWMSAGESFEAEWAQDRAALQYDDFAVSVSPSPFNPTTVISFQLSAVSLVRAEIFDLAGRRVALLTEGRKEAGKHRTVFNATGLPSGIYFYRISAVGLDRGESLVEEGKILLLK
jgi:hypothetical protein